MTKPHADWVPNAQVAAQVAELVDTFGCASLARMYACRHGVTFPLALRRLEGIRYGYRAKVHRAEAERWALLGRSL